MTAGFTSASPPEFPLTYTDDDGTDYDLADEEVARLRVEFADDHDPRYRCLDRSARRVRLIVWNLELLCAQVVPDDFDPALIEVFETRLGDHGGRYAVETFGETALRAVELDVARQRALPATWQSGGVRLAEDRETLTSSRMTAHEFHRLWMSARTGDAYFAGGAGATRW